MRRAPDNGFKWRVSEFTTEVTTFSTPNGGTGSSTQNFVDLTNQQKHRVENKLFSPDGQCHGALKCGRRSSAHPADIFSVKNNGGGTTVLA